MRLHAVQQARFDNSRRVTNRDQYDPVPALLRTLYDRMISIGVLTPHAAAGPAAELPGMAPGQVVTRVSRIPAPGATVSSPGTPPTSPSGLRALTAPSALDTAVAAFASGSVDAIGYASTSTGYAIGFEAEATMLERLS